MKDSLSKSLRNLERQRNFMLLFGLLSIFSGVFINYKLVNLLRETVKQIPASVLEVIMTTPIITH